MSKVTETLDLANKLIGMLNDQLQSEYTAKEFARRQGEEKAQFVMAFGCYVLWLAKKSLETQVPQETVQSAFEDLHRALVTCSWYRLGQYERIWDSIQHALPHMRPGKHFGILMPFAHVVEAANLAGCTLSHSNDTHFNFYTIALVKQVQEEVSSWLEKQQ
jgi:hypothetical protein